MSKNTPSKRRQKLSPAMQVTVIVAIIGCAGTLLGAIVSGAFMYLTTRAQIDRPIAFTQTAEFRPTQQVIAFDWKSILSIDPDTICPAVYTPDYLFAGTDKFAWVKDHLASSYANDQLMYAPNGLGIGDMDGNISLHLTITASPGNQDWIRLSNKLTVTIRRIDDGPATSEIMQFGGCGAGGTYRAFSSVSLDLDYPEYDVISTSSDADFFTLQPGEFEVFVLGLHCSSPGLYAVQVNVPVTFQGREEIVAYTDFPGINCPGQLNYNLVDATGESPDFYLTIYDVEQYQWTGSGYEKLNP